MKRPKFAIYPDLSKIQCTDNNTSSTYAIAKTERRGRQQKEQRFDSAIRGSGQKGEREIGGDQDRKGDRGRKRGRAGEKGSRRSAIPEIINKHQGDQDRKGERSGEKGSRRFAIPDIMNKHQGDQDRKGGRLGVR